MNQHVFQYLSWWTAEEARVAKVPWAGTELSFQIPCALFRILEVVAKAFICAAQGTSVHMRVSWVHGLKISDLKTPQNCQAWSSWQVLAAPGVAVVSDLGLDFIPKNVSLHPCPSAGKSRGISKGQSQALFSWSFLEVNMLEFHFGGKFRKITFDPAENATEFLYLLHVASSADTYLPSCSTIPEQIWKNVRNNYSVQDPQEQRKLTECGSRDGLTEDQKIHLFFFSLENRFLFIKEHDWRTSSKRMDVCIHSSSANKTVLQLNFYCFCSACAVAKKKLEYKRKSRHKIWIEALWRHC